MKKSFLTIVGLLMIATAVSAQKRAVSVQEAAVSAQDIELPKPQTSGGIPLMDALSKRQSTRSFSEEMIDEQMLSNLLWAAWGYNRENKRTAPSGMDKQEIDLYVVLKSGTYLYDAKANRLVLVIKEDMRKSVSATQEFAQNAPLHIVFVADTKKADGVMTTAYISQNIYLFCASEGLGTVARGWFNAEEVHKDLKLKENQKVILVQPVGRVK